MLGKRGFSGFAIDVGQIVAWVVWVYKILAWVVVGVKFDAGLKTAKSLNVL